MVESDAVRELKAIADRLDQLNMRLEAENARFREAILLLTEAVDTILASYVAADQESIERARAANEAAKRTLIE